ncbi:MAG: hypothetical protein NTW19_02315, partial [Planctomycetota bacterium]|nr:hypothetical protein [Planctomycetota bacterium]
RGAEATGRGSIYLSDLWSWPDPALTHAQRDAALRAFCLQLAADLPGVVGEPAHPLEAGLRLHDHIAHGKASRSPDDAAAQPFPPILARAMAASPFDAAIHDAVGRALGKSAFALYGAPAPIPSADALFPGNGAGGGAVRAIAAMLRPAPLRAFDVWLIVGKDDDLERDVRPWVVDRGVRAFKLKILGRDNAVDAARAAAVFRRRWASPVPG